jgi:hypothetical protein
MSCSRWSRLAAGHYVLGDTWSLRSWTRSSGWWVLRCGRPWGRWLVGEGSAVRTYAPFRTVAEAMRAVELGRGRGRDGLPRS